jgi:hypothetical protein
MVHKRSRARSRKKLYAFEAKKALEAQREGVTATRWGGCRQGKRNPPPNVAGGVAETKAARPESRLLRSTCRSGKP